LRTSRSLSGRAARHKSGFLINQKRELTSLPVLRYSSGHKKGGLKILSLSDKAVIAVRKYLINAVNGFRDGKEPPHLVRDPAKNHFPHVDVIAEIIPANVHWSQYYPHLSAGVSTSAADTLDDPEFREPLATGVGKE
jgi:hypothetical protein